MKTKNILSIFAMFAFIVFSLAAVNAQITLTDVSVQDEVSHNAGSIVMTFNITNDAGPADIDWDNTFTSGNGSITFSQDNVANGTDEEVTTTIVAILSFPAHQSGNLAGKIIATDKDNDTNSDETSFSVEITQLRAMTATTTKELTKNQNGTITIENTGNTPFNNIQLTTSGQLEVNLSQTAIPFLNAGNSAEVTVSSSALDNLNIGSNIATITATALEGTTASTQVNVDGSFCDFGEVGTFLEINSITDEELDNEDEWEWKPLDDIEIEVEVENNDDDDDIDVTVELIFLDENGNDVTNDIVEDDDDLEEDINIDDNDEETATFKFRIDADVEEGNYRLFVKAYEEGDEDKQCTSLRAEGVGNEVTIDIDRDLRDVIVNEVLGPSTVACGSFAELEARVYNIGSKDEDRVKVIVSNDELGIEMEQEVDDLDEGDPAKVTFTIDIPETAEAGTYAFEFETRYDYDEDDDFYDEASDAEDNFDYLLEVLGDCNAEDPAGLSPSISASLASEAREGENLIIDVMVTNNADSTATYIVNANGFDSWAELVEVNPQILSLTSGQTKQATITLNPTSTGTQTFNIRVSSNGETYTRPVSVVVEETEDQSLDFFTGAFGSLDSTQAYIVAGIIIVLIAIIIVLIIKFSKSNKKDF